MKLRVILSFPGFKVVLEINKAAFLKNYKDSSIFHVFFFKKPCQIRVASYNKKISMHRVETGKTPILFTK